MAGEGLRRHSLPVRYYKSKEADLRKTDLSPGILRSISETLTWCSFRQPFGRPFRTHDLDPTAILDIPVFSHELGSIEAWIERKRDCYRRAISWINETRAELLKAGKIEALEANEVLSRCKLLMYEPLETVDDGAAEAASMGFYDLHDAPPGDNWFLYADHAVFCCIPEFAISLAQNGIDANPVDCIHWADWSRLARIED
jgi:hypothetical protein